jgi:hypothetical protein
MKTAVAWDVTQCGSYKNRSLAGIYRLHYQFEKNQLVRNNVSSDYQGSYCQLLLTLFLVRRLLSP